MTTIAYLKDGIIIDGHAENPVVCHGISAISQMVSGFVQERNWGDVLIRDGHLEIRNIKEEHQGNELFQAMVIALEDISMQYQECVKIERG